MGLSVDIIDQVPTQMVKSLEKSSKTKVLSKAGLRPMGFSMITIREPYDDIRVRRALNYAVPVEAICEKLFMGYAKPSDSPIAFDTIGHKSIGGFDYNSLSDLLGYQLGVAITGSEKIGPSLIITEGFGKIKMADTPTGTNNDIIPKINRTKEINKS